MGFLSETFGEGGGGRYVGQVVVRLGFKSYQKGLSLGESFFPFENTKEARDAAFEKANEVDPDLDPRSSGAIRLTIIKDSILNKDMSNFWPAGDRHHDYQQWTAAAREVIEPSLVETGFNPEEDLGNPFWARVSFKPDPYQVERGRDEPDLIPFIVERFPSREAALEALGDSAVTMSANGIEVDPPPGWKDDTPWNTWVETVVDLLKDELPDDATPVQVTGAVNSVFKALDARVPKDTIREVANQITIPF